MNNNKHAAMMERKQEMMQQRHEAGSVATHFPEVASIVMNMTYNQRGTKSILRTFKFTPNSYAFFIVNCLRQDCVGGGFDLTQVITAMIRNRKAEAKGALICKGTDSSASHSDIVYEVAIQYT
ncbi:MAG: hypothetical protein AB1610_10970 [Nitrospirota bacterium]